jgi:hypothetical protein
MAPSTRGSHWFSVPSAQSIRRGVVGVRGPRMERGGSISHAAATRGTQRTGGEDPCSGAGCVVAAPLRSQDGL